MNSEMNTGSADSTDWKAGNGAPHASSTMSAHPRTGPGKDRRFFGQPRALATLFQLELWERFSFYGMQGILTIYLYFEITAGGLGLPEATAVGVAGAYAGSVYLATILGAWVADRLFGAERVLLTSAIIIMAGHLTLALIVGFTGLTIGLVLIAIGAGGLKANATAIVGSLYRDSDPRRDAGFTIFYMATTLGALTGPMLTGVVQVAWGFHLGFGLAAGGMGVGLAVYISARKSLPSSVSAVPNPVSASRRWIPVAISLALAIAVAMGVITKAMTPANIVNWVAGASLFALVTYFVMMLVSTKVDRDERSRALSFIPMLFSTIVFLALTMQIWGVLTTYADAEVDRSIGGWEMPVPWVITLYSLVIAALAPLFSLLWTRLGKRQPSSPMKIGLALPITGVGFLLFIPYANAHEANATPLMWVVLILVLLSAAEVMLMPIGIALSTALGPKAFKTQMVSVYYLAVGLGSSLAGVFGQFYDPNDQVPYWTVLGSLAIVAGGVQILLSRPLRKMMGGVV